MSTGIQVDLTALTGVFTDLRRDVDQGMTPSTQGATGDLGDTARFGGTSASGEVIAGATDVTYAASIAAHNVGVHIDNAYAIAGLIEGAVAGYRIADGLSGQEFSLLSGGRTPGDGPPSGGGTGASGAGLTPVFVGPLPAPKIPRQALTDSPYALNWSSYDTPRMWSMVNLEVSEDAWAQMHAFRRLSDALSDQHRRMLALRSRLVAAWSPQGAGAEVLDLWDRHTADLESDAMCAYMTAQAMGNILQTLSDARAKLAKLNETWQHVTSDYMPEWWDHKAELTDAQARLVMVETEKAVADFRRHIAIPRPVTTTLDQVAVGSAEPEGGLGNTGGSTPGGGRGAGSSTEQSNVGGAGKPPPPLPGTAPVLDVPGLAGSPEPVGVAPSTPPSTLPIPPTASSLAPGGGAYVLPNRWLSDGRVLQMPSSQSPSAVAVRQAGSGTTAGPGPGMFGIPGAPGGSRPDGRANSHGRATEQWEVATGVPPVIQPPEQPETENETSEIDEEMERFRQWYKEVSTPWVTGEEHDRVTKNAI